MAAGTLRVGHGIRPLQSEADSAAVRPADDSPKYDDDDNPPTWKDFVKAANKARKSLKDLKP